MVIFEEAADPADLSRRERKKQATHRRLYDAAVELFRTRGYDETTVDDITAAAGTAKGTFFNYFETKAHVLVAYHDDMTGRILGRLEEGRGGESAEAAVQRAMGVCADWVERDPEMGALIVRKLFETQVLYSTDLRNSRRFLEWFEVQIREGMARGELREDLDVPITLSMLAAVLSSTMNEWVLRPGQFDLRHGLERKTRFVFDAARVRER